MYSSASAATGTTVTAATTGTALAFTGAHVVGLIILGAALLFSGVTVLAFGRFRFRRS
jgi:hypothetical protein